MSSAASSECGLPSFGLEILPTSSASVLISLRGLNGTRPSHCPKLSKVHFQLFMHRKAQGRWQGLISGLLPRELPGVRCSDEHGCVFRACLFSDPSGSPKSATDRHCTQPSSVLVTPPPELPSPQPHLAARLELVVSPPFAPPMPTAARAWAKQLSVQLSFAGFSDFRLLAVEVSSTGEVKGIQRSRSIVRVPRMLRR